MSTSRRIDYIEFTELRDQYLGEDIYWWVVVIDRVTGIAYSSYMRVESFLRDDVQDFVIGLESEKFEEKLRHKYNNWPWRKVRVK